MLTDNFSNKPVTVGQTHAYIYTSQNPIGFRGGAQYNYYTGQVIKTFNLLPGSSTEEQVVTTSYDFADRPLQTDRPDGGYVRTGYWDNFLNLSTYQQIASGQVRFKFEEYDGAGRVRRKGADHPGAVSGKYSGQQLMYDQVGHQSDASNVIAMNGDWTPADEDAPPTGLGWIYTNKTYDEMGRPTLLTKPDNSTVEYQYDSCGCAGGTVTRIDELGCIRRSKADWLGRLMEASENPDPNDLSYVYTKAVYAYDVLDRLVTIEHYGSGWGPTKKQTRSFAYDGYGRLQSETTPEGGTVSYSYTANDLVQTRTDPRGMVATSSYNTRNLVTGVSYNDGGATPAVSFQYDDYGARSQMTDGEGTTVYTYNAHRQLESERRSFTGIAGRSYTLSHTYNQADQVTRATYSSAQSGGNNLWAPPNSRTQVAAVQSGASSIQQPADSQAAIGQEPSPLGSGSLRDGKDPLWQWLRKEGGGWASYALGWNLLWTPAERWSSEERQPELRTETAAAVMTRATSSRGARPVTYKISGTITNTRGKGQSGVTVTISNGGESPQVTNSAGYYEFTGVIGGYNYTVTPSKNGYTFTPTNKSFFPLNSNKVADFSCSGPEVAGKVSSTQGQGIGGVTVNLTGTENRTTTTDANGDYAFEGLTPGGNYTATPSRTGYSFTPSQQSFTNVTSPQTANFTGNVVAPPPDGVLVDFSKNINYAYNSAGALTGVGTDLIGSDPNTTSNVVSTAAFRGFGALKSLNYGNGRTLALTYSDQRHFLASMVVNRSDGSDPIINNTYTYFNDGRIQKITDNDDPAYTTDFSYDVYHRLTSAAAGPTGNRTYTRSYSYDEWGNLRSVTGTGGGEAPSYTINYANNATGAPATNRILNVNGTTSYTYDAAGNLTQEGSTSYS